MCVRERERDVMFLSLSLCVPLSLSFTEVHVNMHIMMRVYDHAIAPAVILGAECGILDLNSYSPLTLTSCLFSIEGAWL